MPTVYRNGHAQEISVASMSADEYGNWVRQNPEEAKKLDEPSAVPVVRTAPGIWVNGVWRETGATHSVKNGIVQ